MSLGILSYGAYIPRLRMSRQAIAAANAWFNPGVKVKGERALANWDEDSVTMAAEAARDCLTGFDRATLGALHLASTTLPFDDRQNSGIVAAALDLDPVVATQDIVATLRTGTSGLIAAFQAAAGGAGSVLFVAADRRRTRASAPQEMAYGDGAAALLVGEGNPIATMLGFASQSVDFVDHYRGHGRDFDYGWEERWIREEGWLKLVPAAIKAALERTGLAADSINHVCIAGTLPRLGQTVARAAGLAEAAVKDNLAAVCGDTGSAHPLLLLAHALETAKPGERILVAGFGQGADALIFEATHAIADLPRKVGVSVSLARRKEETSYGKFLAYNDIVELERGMRAEADKATALSALYRNRRMLMGLVGGRCRKCGTVQFPRTPICVGPNCHAFHSQDDYSFADAPGKVMSYTADLLTYSLDPPQHCGMIQFDEGGRMMADFTDVDAGHVAVGMPMRMAFRIKDRDAARGFTRYFWKATPVAAANGGQ